MSVLSGSPVKGVSIATSTNAAYEMMKQGPGVESEGYEVIDVPQRGGPTLTNIEAAYEIPSVPYLTYHLLCVRLDKRRMKKKKKMEYMRQSLEITER